MIFNAFFIGFFIMNVCCAMGEPENQPLELKVVEFGKGKLHCCFDPNTNILIVSDENLTVIPIKTNKQRESIAQNLSDALKEAYDEWCTIS